MDCRMQLAIQACSRPSLKDSRGVVEAAAVREFCKSNDRGDCVAGEGREHGVEPGRGDRGMGGAWGGVSGGTGPPGIATGGGLGCSQRDLPGWPPGSKEWRRLRLRIV